MKIEYFKEGQSVWIKGVADAHGFISFYNHAGDEFDYVSEYDVREMKKEDVQLDQLDQPELEVPQFVADWYEEYKEYLEYNLYLYQMSIYDGKAKKDDFYYWMQKTNNPVHKLINMHQFGYTVEKEKLYTVEILGNKLYKMTSDNHTRYRFYHKTEALPFYNIYDFSSKLTESEVKASDERLWQFREEVTE